MGCARGFAFLLAVIICASKRAREWLELLCIDLAFHLQRGKAIPRGYLFRFSIHEV